MNQRPDVSLAQFAGRPLAEAFPYLILDARYERVREAGVIASQAVLIAIGIDWDGRRQVLAVELANRESRSSWRDFLSGLKARGLHGHLQTYLADLRAGVAALRGSRIGTSSDALWLSMYGPPMTDNGVYNRIVARTREGLGQPINPHLFRDCAATSVAIDDPAHIGIASRSARVPADAPRAASCREREAVTALAHALFRDDGSPQRRRLRKNRKPRRGNTGVFRKSDPGGGLGSPRI
jgi:hypothetical protein